jgi:hypothetical protein
MKRLLLLSLVLTLAGCATPAADTQPANTPKSAESYRVEFTPTPVPVDSAGDMLVFGDSDMMFAYEYYDDYYAEALGVPVTVYDRTRFPNPSELWVGWLQSDEDLRELIAMAEVVAFNVPLVAPSSGGYCFREEVALEDGCFRESLETYTANTRAIIQEIKSLAGDQPVIIRLQNGLVPVDWWGEMGMAERVEPCLACYEQYFAALAQVAEEEGVGYIDVLHAFNGADLAQNPTTTGMLGDDGMHINDRGAQFVADLYRQAGAEAWEP